MKERNSLLNSDKLNSFFRIFGVTIQGEGSIWQTALKDAKRVVGLCLRALPILVGSSKIGYVKACFVFTKRAVSIYRRQGSKGCAKYFKACTLLLMKSCGGDVLRESMKAGHCVSITRSGLPRIIPVAHRKRIRAGEGIIIHFWLSLFSIYRVVDFKGVPSISTITTPGVELSKDFLEAWDSFLDTFFFPKLDLFTNYKLLNRFSRNLPWVLSTRKDLWKASFLLLLRGGPNSVFSSEAAGPTPNIGNLFEDAMAWVARPELLATLRAFVEATGNGIMVFYAAPFRVLLDSDYLVRCSGWVSEVWSSLSGSNHPLLKTRSRDRPLGSLGRLAFLNEPGKVRVVAMLDSWSQILLYPIHYVIFNRMLKCIPQDGTFNQYRPIEALLATLKKKGFKKVYSFDLSAATDRLPIKIQEIVLSYIVGQPLATLWTKLLTDRYYTGPSKVNGVKTGIPSKGIKYAVGQPMGAYSSWAMLALTHHAIVQFAAWKCGGKSWFRDYALLGDDVVIFHTNVAMAYLGIMRELGVEISFAKSLSSSNGSFEFAKKYIHCGVDVSPTTLKHISSGFSGLKFIPELITSTRRVLGDKVGLPQAAKFAGLGFKAQSAVHQRPITVGNRFKGLMLLLTAPNGPFGVATLAQWLTLMTVTTSREVDHSLLKGVFIPVFQLVLKRMLKDFEGTYEELRKQLSMCLAAEIPEQENWFNVHILTLLAPIRKHYKAGERLVAELWILGGSSDLTLDSMLSLVERIFKEFSYIPKSLFASPDESLKLQAGIWIRFWVLFNDTLLEHAKPKPEPTHEPYWVRYSKRVRPFPGNG